MNYTNENKLEQLERKVQELERKLKDRDGKRDTVREVEARFAGYQDVVRSDKGQIYLKKNFVIENRKAMEASDLEGRIAPDVDNSTTLHFNNSEVSRLNHLFLGYASAKGQYNTALLAGAATVKENIADVTSKGETYKNPNNGRIQLKVYHEKYFNDDGRPEPTSPDGGQPNLTIANRELFTGQEGTEGVVAQLIGTGKNPYSSIGVFVEDSLNPSTFLACDKDNVYIYGIPSSDPGVAGAIFRDGTALKISLG